MPVSPPPITITFLPVAAITLSGLDRAGRAALLGGHPAIALVEVVHREVDPAELAPGHIHVA